jgi:LuxR family glucitol operon transcriptional activator
MLKRTTLDGKSRDGTIQLSLTDVSLDYISRFAPPDKSIFDKIQQASKKLNLQIQMSSVRQAAYKFDLYAVRASTRDQKIAAFHLNAALVHSKTADFSGARKNIDAAKALLPTFAETYRVSSLIESKDNELYKALQEIEEAAQLDSESALIHYQFANFLTNTLEEYERALEECNAAIRCDPKDDTPVTLKALVLTRLGRYTEAATLYEAILETLAEKPKRWRISTRDQAAECYRRFSEQDRVMKNGSAFESHIARACEILNDALATTDYDRSTGRLYCSIIEDALFYSLRERNETYGMLHLAKLMDVAQLLSIHPFKSMSLEKVETTFGANSSLANAFQRYLERLGT